MLCVFFALCTLFALAGLCLVCPRDVPRIAGTAAVIVTFAALAVSITR
ncbi:hypothetical protein BX257_4761 [Streptomyces sp. 3212.3]|nr:hypothetical protein [Streptomyces sp. 3212.3]REE62148.1 hypothetical protein BX257_4761 [Streptomyces sp. 3212.3]